MTISELKKEAKSKLSGNLWKAIAVFLIYTIITVILEIILGLIKNKALAFIYSILLIIISVPFSYGITVCMIKIARKEDFSIFDFISIGLKNISKIWKTIGRMIQKLILPIILFIITLILFYLAFFYLVYTVFSIQSYETSAVILIFVSLFLLALSMIYLSIKSFLYILFPYIIYDHEDYTAKEVVEKSADLMNGNRKKYFCLCFSFIGWILLIFLVSKVLLKINPVLGSIAFSTGILILYPYIFISIINFYEDLTADTVEKNDDNQPINDVEV